MISLKNSIQGFKTRKRSSFEVAYMDLEKSSSRTGISTKSSSSIRLLNFTMLLVVEPLIDFSLLHLRTSKSPYAPTIKTSGIYIRKVLLEKISTSIGRKTINTCDPTNKIDVSSTKKRERADRGWCR